jgi:C-terminal processing protease CtpA/Prc
VARIVRAAAVYGTPAELPSLAAVKQSCGADALCAAREIVAASAGRVRLEAVAHPESDTIRWAETAPSVTAVQEGRDGRRWIVLDAFGRKADREMAEILARARTDGTPLGLDLRGNAGGDFGRMLRVAALFTGNIKDALFLIDLEGKIPVDIGSDGPRDRAQGLEVLVGPGTASSAEVLAALLQRYAGARLAGSPTVGKDYLTRVIAVDQDWRLLVPAERIEVPGVDLTGGLQPAEGLPADAPDAPPERRS